MTTAAEDLRLQISHDLPHAPERVFDAWLDPDLLAKFMIPGSGVTVPEAEADPRVGGRFRIVMHTPDGQDLPHSGTYKEIDRVRKLVFTWESPYSTETDSTVTLDLEPEGEGTRLTLTHIRFPDAESRDNHEGGWGHILKTLAGVL